MSFDFIAREKFTEVDAFALAKPPSWTRLEPSVRPETHARAWRRGSTTRCGSSAGSGSWASSRARTPAPRSRSAR